MPSFGKAKAQAKKHVLPKYPADHKVGMHVPQGGSDCAKCEYVEGNQCKNDIFVRWNGRADIPAPTNEYCCDFFEIGEQA